MKERGIERGDREDGGMVGWGEQSITKRERENNRGKHAFKEMYTHTHA